MQSPEVKYTQIFINNEWKNSVSGKTFPTINPSTGQKTCDVQEGDKADIDLAVKAAREAVKLGSSWSSMDASQRGRLMCKLADLVERDTGYLAGLETLDNGLLLTHARGSAERGVAMLRYFASWADKIHGKTIPIDGNYFCYTRREPKGVIGIVVPWNYPIITTFRKLTSSLCCGNSVIIKPAEHTPLTALYLAALCKEPTTNNLHCDITGHEKKCLIAEEGNPDSFTFTLSSILTFSVIVTSDTREHTFSPTAAKAGFPPGVVNVVPGYGPTAGAAISEHMDIDVVSFTGSVEVAKLVTQAAGRSNLKHIVIESGGKSPIIIFPDTDMAYAVEVSHNGLHKHSGQVCTAASRTFVHEDIYDEFVLRSVERAKRRVIGDPYDYRTESGPQIGEESYNRVMDLIKSGKQEGAKLECGGKRIMIAGKDGFFIEPTVFSNVQDDMRIATEEIFGPVQQIIKFKTVEEVIERANRSRFGLAASVLTKDINKALTIANSVQAGIVWVNKHGGIPVEVPFGGYKMSGLGREGGEESLNELTEIKTVIVKIQETNS